MTRPPASAVAALTAGAVLVGTAGAVAGLSGGFVPGTAGTAVAAAAKHRPKHCTYPPQAALLTLSVTASRVRAGHHDAAFGVLFQSRCVVSRAKIQIRVDGTTVATRRTNGNGVFDYDFRPRHSETLQAVFTGNRTAGPAQSRRVQVHVVPTPRRHHHH